jgi:hypothetical protein
MRWRQPDSRSKGGIKDVTALGDLMTLMIVPTSCETFIGIAAAKWYNVHDGAGIRNDMILSSL